MNAPITSSPLLSLRGICKSYGAVTALHGIDLDVEAGTILAICGDNGAGKSSLIRIISGAQAPSSGTLSLHGKTVSFRSPLHALHQGVATIYQDLALALRLSVAANVFMGSELTCPVLKLSFCRRLDKRRMREEARQYLAQLSSAVTDMRTPVERLSGGQRQAVAIARALRWKAKVIIMDEPTAALGVKESALVLSLVERLREEGKTVLLISHNMRDVIRLADRVAILRGGRKVVDRPVAGLAPDDLTHLIMHDSTPT